MGVKFRIGFTMDAETLFGAISKFLPVQDLHVEEVLERPIPDPAIRFDKKFDLPKPKKLPSVRKWAKSRTSIPMNLDRGINAIVMGLLADGKPHHSNEFRPLLEKNKYSGNSIGSRLQFLEDKGIIKRMGNGMYVANTTKVIQSV